MVVVAAGGVEGGVARGADRITLEVGGDGESGTAGAAEDSVLMELGGGPRLDGVVGQGIVAVFAGVEEAAALHFDGDDVERGMEVKAASLGIEMEAVDVCSRLRHGMGEEGE
ncbi:MAG: hypothetical protein WB543_04070 [Candidatus Acidiferrum sp.]